MEYLSISTEQLWIGEQLAQKILAFGNLDSLQEKYNLIQDLEILFWKTINTGDVVSKIRDELSNILWQNDFSLDNLMEHFISMDLKKRIRARKKIIRVLCSNPDDIIKKYCWIEAFMAQPQYKVLKLREFFMLQKNRKYLRYFTPDYYGKKNDGESDVRTFLQSKLWCRLPENFQWFQKLFEEKGVCDWWDLVSHLLEDGNIEHYNQYLKVYNLFKNVEYNNDVNYVRILQNKPNKLWYVIEIAQKKLWINLFEWFWDELLADIENIKPYVTLEDLCEFFSEPKNWKYYIYFHYTKGKESYKKNQAIHNMESLLGCVVCDWDLKKLLKNPIATIRDFFPIICEKSENGHFFELYFRICRAFTYELKYQIQGKSIGERKKSIKKIINGNIEKIVHRSVEEIINEKYCSADWWKYANKETKDFIVSDVLQFVDYFKLYTDIKSFMGKKWILPQWRTYEQKKKSIRKIIDENYCDDKEVSGDRWKWMNTENQNIIVELLLKSFWEKLWWNSYD